MIAAVAQTLPPVRRDANRRRGDVENARRRWAEMAAGRAVCRDRVCLEVAV